MAPPPNKVKRTNRLPKTNASSKLGLGRRKDKDVGSARSAETIKRLKMYTDKPIRNKKGKIVAGSFMMKDRAGDRTIDGSTGRIQPDRRWFGNTRVVDPKELDTFRQSMTEKVADPYSVVLKRKKLPMGLLQEAAEYTASNKTGALLEQEPFEHAFGKHSRRKRVKLDELLVTRTLDNSKKGGTNQGNKKQGEGEAEAIAIVHPTDDDDDDKGDTAGYEALVQTAQKSLNTYEEINAREGMVPWGRDSNLQKDQDWRPAPKHDLFCKGQSKRIWGEFFKVVDCSDVILHVIDARNVPGTRCTMIERHVRDNASHKHLVFVLNKIDLVPNWVAKRWMGELARDRPTIAFHASLTHAFGKGALINLLRQFGKLHEDKKQISVGVIGYPNVGKSSVINTLISKKGCKVAPIPGETKIWQYITLFKRISLIDCPGVVVDTAGDTETDSVLKSVIRSERLESPEDFVEPILERVRREHIAAQYKLPKKGEGTWTDATTLMELIAKRSGRLLKGGEPCLRSSAISIINDFQRGRLPHFVPPPELKQQDVAPGAVDAAPMIDGIKPVEQDLDAIGGPDNDEKDDSKTAVEQDEEEDKKQGAKSDDDKPDAEADASKKKEDDDSGLIGEGEWDD